MPATPYLDALRTYLSQRHRDTGPLWAYSENNQLPQDWLVATPSQVWGKRYEDFPQQVAADNPALSLAPCTNAAGPAQLCELVGASVSEPGTSPQRLRVGHSWQIFEAMYDVMTSATVLLDFTTLTPPTGLFLEAFRNAITLLSRKPETERPIIRILFSNPLPDLPPLTAAPFLESITEQLDPSQRLEIYVTVLTSSFASWNHAKIVAADGVRALVGGHNMWASHYLAENPVFDVSMKASGTAARHAQDYAQGMWAYQAWRLNNLAAWIIGGNPNGKLNYHASYKYQPTKGKCVITPGDTPPDTLYSTATARFAEPSTAKGTAVLSIGRGGNTRSSYLLPTLYSYLVPFTEPSDEAIVHLVGQATRSVRMSLQSFHLGPQGIIAGWNIDLLRAMGQALQRGCSIDVVVSNPNAVAGGLTKLSAPYDGETPEEINEALRQALIFEVGMTQADASVLIARRFRCAGFRYGTDSTYPKGAPIPNHAKTLIVDDRVFLIGSQNMYVSNLNEFGWVVEDAQAAADYVARYWTPLWSSAGPTASPGFDTDVVVSQELEAVEFVLAMDHNTRLSIVFDDLKAKHDASTDAPTRAALEAQLEELIINGGYATTWPKVQQALATPFFSQSPPSAEPTSEALRFVINAMSSPALMRQFSKAVDAPAESADAANQHITVFLRANGYGCSALEVVAAFNALRRKVLSYWAGDYPTWLTEDGGASFTLGNHSVPRDTGTDSAGDTVRASAGSADESPRKLPALGPVLTINGDGTVTFDGRKIESPIFDENTLSWRLGSGGQGNVCTARLQFGTVTRGTINDSFTGTECFGVVTWPDCAPSQGHPSCACSLYGRGPSRASSGGGGGDSPDRTGSTVIYVASAIAMAGLLALLGLMVFRARARAQQYEQIGREKRDRELDDFMPSDEDTVSSPGREIEANVLAGQRLQDGLRLQRQALEELVQYESVMSQSQRLSAARAANDIKEANNKLDEAVPDDLPEVLKNQREVFGGLQETLTSLGEALAMHLSVEEGVKVQESLASASRVSEQVDSILEQQEEGLPFEEELI